MDLSKLSLGDKILGGTAIVLIIDLIFFSWHSASSSSFGVTYSYSASAIESPNGFWGILALLLTIAILGVTIVRKLTDTPLPDAPKPWGELTFYAAAAVAVLLLIKLVSETDALGFGAYLAILLAGGMAYGGFLGKDEADDAPAAGGSTDGGAPTPF